MNDTHHKHHEHSLVSSRDDLDAEEILTRAELHREEYFLDIGCGDGHFSLAASTIVGIRGHVTALDIDPRSAEIVREAITDNHISNILPITADATKGIPLSHASVDYCLISNVMHGIVADEEFVVLMDEILRVLKPDGRILVIDFKKSETPHGPPLNIRISPKELTQLFAPLDLRVSNIAEAGPQHYFALFERV